MFGKAHLSLLLEHSRRGVFVPTALQGRVSALLKFDWSTAESQIHHSTPQGRRRGTAFRGTHHRVGASAKCVYTDIIYRRRVVSRRVNSTRRYEYLAKWENWEVYDSTWQSPKSFDGTMKMLEEAFLARCMIEGLNERSKVVLVSEAEDFWDENGDLKEDVLEELGIPEAEWWPEAKGKYRVQVA